MTDWQPIETALSGDAWLRTDSNHCLIGCWFQPKDEDGEPTEPGHWSWLHVARLSYDGWRVNTGGLKGLHGFATFPLVENATHWKPIDNPVLEISA